MHLVPTDPGFLVRLPSVACLFSLLLVTVVAPFCNLKANAYWTVLMKDIKHQSW